MVEVNMGHGDVSVASGLRRAIDRSSYFSVLPDTPDHFYRPLSKNREQALFIAEKLHVHYHEESDRKTVNRHYLDSVQSLLEEEFEAPYVHGKSRDLYGSLLRWGWIESYVEDGVSICRLSESFLSFFRSFVVNNNSSFDSLADVAEFLDRLRNHYEFNRIGGLKALCEDDRRNTTELHKRARRIQDYVMTELDLVSTGLLLQDEDIRKLIIQDIHNCFSIRTDVSGLLKPLRDILDDSDTISRLTERAMESGAKRNDFETSFREIRNDLAEIRDQLKESRKRREDIRIISSDIISRSNDASEKTTRFNIRSRMKIDYDLILDALEKHDDNEYVTLPCIGPGIINPERVCKLRKPEERRLKTRRAIASSPIMESRETTLEMSRIRRVAKGNGYRSMDDFRASDFGEDLSPVEVRHIHASLLCINSPENMPETLPEIHQMGNIRYMNFSIRHDDNET